MAIREYTPQIEGLQPNERAAESRVRAGREIDANYGFISNTINKTGTEVDSAIKVAGNEYVKYEQTREVNTGAPAFAAMLSEDQKDWDKTLQANPGDPTVQAQFLSAMEERLQKFKDNFRTEGGRKWAESKIDSYREHRLTTTTSDMMAAEASQVTVRLDHLTNITSASAASRPTIPNLKHLVQSYSDDIDTMVAGSNLKGTAAIKVQEELKQKGLEKIVRSAAYALTMINPEAGERLAKDPAFAKYVDGDELRKQASAAERINKAETRLAEREAKLADRKAIDESLANIVLSTIQDDESVRVLPGTMLKLRNEAVRLKMSETDVMKTVAFLQREKGRGDLSDPDILADLTSRIHLRPGDPGEITIRELAGYAATPGQLVEKDFKRFARVVRSSDPQLRSSLGDLHKAIGSFRGSIVKSTRDFVDIEGGQRFGHFEQAAIRMFEETYHAEGRKAAMDLINLSKAGNILSQMALEAQGKKGLTNSVNRTLKQTKDGIPIIAPTFPADPRLRQRPEESGEDWLKRNPLKGN